MRALRIAYLIESADAGAGRHVTDLARGVADQGHDVCVIWSPVRSGPGFVARLECLNTVTNYALPIQRSVGIHDLQSLRALAKLLTSIGPFDVLHGHSSKAGALMRLLPSRIPGIRVYTPHAFRSMDPTLNPFSRTAIAIAEYILALRCDKIVVLCQKEFETARQLAIPESKLVIIQNGCDTPELPSRSNARRELGLNEEDIVLGFVGRFTHQKAPERLIDALKYIENPNVKCVLVGDGDLEETLKRQVCALGLSNRVLFAGSRSGQLAMPAFDILVIPSRYESAPYVLLEAFHAGIPVVSTPTGNAEDLIEDGFNGRIASESNDAKSWGSLLTKMLLPETLVKLRKHAQERRQVVTVEDMVSNTMGLYKNTIYEIGNRRRRRSKFL